MCVFLPTASARGFDDEGIRHGGGLVERWGHPAPCVRLARGASKRAVLLHRVFVCALPLSFRNPSLNSPSLVAHTLYVFVDVLVCWIVGGLLHIFTLQRV